MGRSLLIEENTQVSINDVLNRQKFQVGLVIGQLSNSKDYAIHFSKCPDPADDEVVVEEVSEDSVNDAEQKIAKNNKRNKKSSLNSEEIDSKWVIEHARQSNRMLPGGLSVIGIYVCSTPEMISKNQGKILACLQTVHKRIDRNKYLRRCMPHDHRYFVHVCMHSKKVTAKTINIGEDSAVFSPAEYKYQNFLSNWSSVSTCVDVNVQFLVPESQQASQTEAKIFYACQHELEDIMSSFATIGSQLIDDEKVVSENTKTKKGKVENKELKITLFKQNNSSSQNDRLEYNKADVYVKFVGSINSKAYVNSKSTYGEAVKAIKYDIIRSILTRVELLCEEAEVNNMCRSVEWSLMSPTRVFAPFGKSCLSFCDYIFKDESADDTLKRFSELLDLNVSKSQLQYPERSPEIAEVSMILNGEAITDQLSDAASDLSNLSTIEEPKDKKFLAAVLAGLAAFTAGIVHFFWRE